jgi:acetyl esterase/lipase
MAAAMTAACGRGASERAAPVGKDGVVSDPVETIRYGDDPSQYAELTLPAGRPHGLVTVIHGGFWKAAYGAELGRPLAARLAELGWAAWNVEYRRVGAGGGFPATFDDVHAALEASASHVPAPARIVTLGHSAGGHLAAWAAARGRFEPWQPARVDVTHVVSQAGVVDLTTAHEQDLGGGAVAALMGAGPDSPTYDRADPRRQVPLDVPVWCVHARDDDTVPFALAEDYVSAARSAGGDATLVEVTGGHFGVIDVDSAAWARIEEILAGLAA